MRNLVRYAAPLAMVWLTLVGCDTLFTEQPPAGEDFESPLDGLDPETARMFAKGDENFEHVFSVDEGVGPIFNNMSCGGCHPGDGRGTPNEALVLGPLGPVQKTDSDFVEARRTRAIGLAGQAWLFKATGSKVAGWVETTQFHT